jgi:hypothetical protein
MYYGVQKNLSQYLLQTARDQKRFTEVNTSRFCLWVLNLVSGT